MAVDNSPLLPDGTPFQSWERPLTLRKTYYVAQRHPHASDGNPGTKERPFRSIGRAAEALQPGERVLIDTGIYREVVRPRRGGAGPEEMISYEAAPGAQVTITGADIWRTDWQPSQGWRHDTPDPGACVWWGRLPEDAFRGTNPFCLTNLPKAACTSKDVRTAVLKFDEPEYWMRRGLVFVDGEPLRQLLDYPDLWEHPGAFWVQDDGMTIHLRLADDSHPSDHEIEFTARDQALVPAVPYLGYIRIKGLCLERVGNGIPVPQCGALSTFCGHHWIIEGNTVRWANGIGIDIGQQTWHRASDAIAGYQIVRNNTISDCGVCGLAGVGGGEDDCLYNTLVEYNRIERCGWHNIEHIYENAGIKLHLVRNSLLRGNIVRDTGYGPGIWLDFDNVNSRVTNNVIINSQSCLLGALFVEASHRTNRVDHNVIYGVRADPRGPGGGGHGIYEHDCDHLLIEGNVVLDCEGTAIYLNLGQTERVSAGRGSTGRKHRVTNNLLSDCAAAIVFPTPDNHSDGNLFGAFREKGPLRIQRPYERLDLQAWREFHDWEAAGRCVEVQADLDEENLTLALSIRKGDTITKHTLALDQPLPLKETPWTV